MSLAHKQVELVGLMIRKKLLFPYLQGTNQIFGKVVTAQAYKL